MSKAVMQQALEAAVKARDFMDRFPEDDFDYSGYLPTVEAIEVLTAALVLPEEAPAIALTAEGPGWHKFPAHLQNPDGRSLMTASYLLNRTGYTALAEILKGMAEDLLRKAPTLPSGAAIAPALASPVAEPVALDDWLFSRLVQQTTAEECAQLCDAQMADGECPERAAYCADAIRTKFAPQGAPALK